MDYTKLIIEYLNSNRFSTTEVADAIGKTGAIPSLYPVSTANYVVGKANCLFTSHGSNYELHCQLDKIEAGDIALVFTKYCDGQAIFGDIVAKYMLDVRNAKAIVTQGAMRDIDELKERDYPVWCSNVTPIGCINKPTSVFPYEEKESLLFKYNNAILVCDECGVVAIQSKYHTQHTIDRLKALRLQEAVWNYCIDTLGWNTERTICYKDYLNHMNLLPEHLQLQLDLLKCDFTSPP